jgi:hypothetical protein
MSDSGRLSGEFLASSARLARPRIRQSSDSACGRAAAANNSFSDGPRARVTTAPPVLSPRFRTTPPDGPGRASPASVNALDYGFAAMTDVRRVDEPHFAALPGLAPPGPDRRQGLALQACNSARSRTVSDTRNDEHSRRPAASARGRFRRAPDPGLRHQPTALLVIRGLARRGRATRRRRLRRSGR